MRALQNSLVDGEVTVGEGAGAKTRLDSGATGDWIDLVHPVDHIDHLIESRD